MSATEMPEGRAPDVVDGDLSLVLPGRGVSAGRGLDWLVQGWKLFVAAPLMWILSFVVMFVAAIAINLIPILGTIVFQVLQTVILGGYMVACRSLEKGEGFELEHLFAGFSRRFAGLLAVGALVLLGWIAIVMVFAAFAGFSVLGAMAVGNVDALGAMAASMGTLMLGTLVVVALSVPLMAAYWFAPALVMMHDVPPMTAMKESFFACFRNFVPFLIYGVVALVLAILAAIPFGLGFIVLLPMIVASIYAGYRDIFTRPEGVAMAAR